MQAEANSDQRDTADAIDLAFLRRFTLGNPDLEAEVLDLFAAQAPKTLATLVEASEPRRWREAAHTLKGSARAVGAVHLGNLAETAERIGPDGANRAAILGDLEAAMAAAIAFIHGGRRA